MILGAPLMMKLLGYPAFCFFVCLLLGGFFWGGGVTSFEFVSSWNLLKFIFL